MATIRKREAADGTVSYQVQIRKKGIKPYTKTFSKKAVAKKWAIEQEAIIERKDFHNLDLDEGTYLAVLFTWYKEQIVPNYAESGHATYEYRLRILDENFGMYAPNKVDSMMIVDYVQDRVDEEMSSDSIRKELQLLSDVFIAAKAIWKVHVPVNPVLEARIIIRKLRMLKPGVERDRRFKEGEYEALMSVKHVHHTVIDYLVVFIVETGLRRGELARSAREHIEGDVLRVPKSKTDWKTGKKGRRVPLSPLAKQTLSFLPVRKDGLLFGIKPRQITQAFDRLCEKAKIEDFRLHDLRHECVSRWFERGFEIQEVASMSGHKDWRSLKRYTHPDADKLAQRMAS